MNRMPMMIIMRAPRGHMTPYASGVPWREAVANSHDHDNTGVEENGPLPKRAPGTLASGVAVRLASQTAILTAVLFYFGWARVRATYAYFGVDVSVLNFSVSDYVLRSVNTAFPLLFAMGLVTLGALLIHDQLRPSLTNNTALAARLMRILAGTGCGLVAAGFVLAVAVTGPGGSALVGPATMLVGLAVTAYAVMLRDLYLERTQSWPFVAVLSLAFLALFWTVGAYANYIGIKVAEQVRASLPTATNVIVYSASDLSLAGPGITVSRIVASEAQYRFRYSGFRLLVSSGDQYFLLPEGWRPGTGAVIVIPVMPGGQGTRVEFQRPTP
jgi:hypothetical protein